MPLEPLLIEDVGPIERLEIKLPEDGGVVVLRGRNGCGKTSALQALQAAMTKKADAPAPRDGSRRGLVEVLGVRMVVGKTTRRTGELLADTLEGRLDVSDLVDPGITSPEAADAKRIKALLSLTSVKPELDLFADLCPGGIERLRELVPPELSEKDDILQLASRVKRAIEVEARKGEGEVQRSESEAQGMEATIQGVDLDGRCDAAELQGELEQAIRAETEIRQKQAHARAMQAAANEARRSMDAAKASGVSDLSLLRAELQDAENVVDSISEQLEQLRQQIAIDEQALRLAVQKRLLLSTSVEQAERHAEAMETWKLTIERAATIETASPDDVGAASAQVRICRQRMERGAVIRQARDVALRAEQAKKRAAVYRAQAEQYRQAAGGVDEVLGDLVSRLGVPLKVRVADGQARLVTSHARGEVPFAELSHGERWRLALDLAIEAVGEGGVLTIRQEAWESLDPENREAIRTHVAGRGVLVFTAAASDGELRAEVLEGEAVEA